MSWDILSKANLQYLLTRLKEITNSFVNWKIHDELGAKNLIKYPYYDISGDGDYWHDYAGMDITCDKYGTIYFNGTSTHSIELSLSEYEINVSDGDYVLTFNTSMTTQHALLNVSYKETPTHSIVICSLNPGESITLSLSSGIGYKIQLQLNSGETCNNDYVKPILTHAEDNDSTYMPYAKSNLDLTVDLNSEISRSQEFGVKNIFDTSGFSSHTFNDGVVCSLASDGSINISGTCTVASEGITFTKEYILDGTYTLYYITNDFSTRMWCRKYINGVADEVLILPLSGYLTTEFTKENNTTYKFELRVSRGVHDGGNIKFMISKGPFTDYNWQPYTMSNKELTQKVNDLDDDKVDWKSFGELGVKNVIPYPYHDIPKSVSGIEWTSDVDGCIHIDGTSPSSPVVAVAYLTGGLSGTTGLTLSGDYILSLQASTENVTLKMYRQKGSTSYGAYSVITGQSKTITCVDDGESFYILYLQCDGETTFDDDYAYPMLRRADDTDNTYQPYAMTNRELTLKAMQPQGHTIKNDSGTSQTQRDNLQFGGVYTHDDSTNGKTQVDIVREFESPSAVEALTGEAAKGFQHTPDTVYRGKTASDIGFDKTGTSFNSTRVQDVLEEVDSKIDDIETEIAGIIKVIKFSGTTTASGALLLPTSASANCIVNIVYDYLYTERGLVFQRGDGYCTCFNNSLQVAANTEVHLIVYYINKPQ